MGPTNPQSLNRYSYVLNNPMKYTDPSGHTWYLNAEQSRKLSSDLRQLSREIRDAGSVTGGLLTAFAGSLGVLALATAAATVLIEAAPIIVAGGLGIVVATLAARDIDILADQIDEFANRKGFIGVALQNNNGKLTIMDRASGESRAWNVPIWLNLPTSLAPGQKVGRINPDEFMFANDA